MNHNTNSLNKFRGGHDAHQTVLSPLEPKSSQKKEECRILPSFLKVLNPPLVAMFCSIMGYCHADFIATFIGWAHFKCIGVCNRLLSYPKFDAGKFHPVVSMRKINKYLNRTLNKFRFLKNDYYWTLVLTLPKEYSVDMFREIKLHRQMAKEFLHLLEKHWYNGAQLGATGFTHLWRSLLPFQPHVHNHLTIPNVVYNRRLKRFVRFNPIVSLKRLAEARKLWGQVCAKYGFSVPETNLEFQWGRVATGDKKDQEKDRGRLIHWLKYCARKPTVDIFNLLTSASAPRYLEGVEKGVFNKDFIDYLVHYDNRAFSYGFMSNLKAHGYKSNPKKLHKCPFCGGDVVRVFEPELDYAVKYVQLTRKNLKGFEDKPPPDWATF